MSMSNSEVFVQPMRNHFLQGLKTGIPIAIGYIPIAIAFGLLARSADIPNYVTLMMSFVIFAGASQFIGVNMIVMGISYWEIIITTFILNFRHFLMSASLSQRISDAPSKKLLALLSFGVTDETFSVASTQSERKLHPYFVIGLNLIAFLSWNVGTWVGVFLAVGLPQSIQNSMGIALYAMFIGLLIPTLKKSRPALVISLIAVLIQSGLHWIAPLFFELSSGWSIIITTVIASAVGVVLFPAKEGEQNEQ